MTTLKSTFVIQYLLISTYSPDYNPHFTQECGISKEEISVLKLIAGAGVTGGSIWKKDAYFPLFFTDITLLEGKGEKYLKCHSDTKVHLFYRCSVWFLYF